MARRPRADPAPATEAAPARGAHCPGVPSPGLRDAPVLDRLCSQFVLTLALRHLARFNLRRDANALLALTGRHLVWPPTVLRRLRDYLAVRVRANEAWRGHAALGDATFIERYGAKAADAEKHLATALKLTPASPIAHLEHGNLLLLLHGDKREDDAAAAFEKAGKLKPRDAMEKLDAEYARSQLE